jgi:hypothetical protein
VLGFANVSTSQIGIGGTVGHFAHSPTELRHNRSVSLLRGVHGCICICICLSVSLEWVDPDAVAHAALLGSFSQAMGNLALGVNREVMVALVRHYKHIGLEQTLLRPGICPCTD